MAWFLRKSFRLGPLRLNLSKRGLGVSAGIKGLRAGVDARGRRYVADGRGGLYFREYGKPEAPPQEPASAAPVPGAAPRSGGWAWFWFIVAMLAVLATIVARAR